MKLRISSIAMPGILFKHSRGAVHGTPFSLDMVLGRWRYRCHDDAALDRPVNEAVMNGQYHAR